MYLNTLTNSRFNSPISELSVNLLLLYLSISVICVSNSC